MVDSELTKLRRARARVHANLRKLEPLIASYYAKAADLEARIQALAPELNLPPRRYAPNPVFARGELPRLAMSILRAAGKPLSTREVAVRALAAKGVTLPDRRTLKVTRLRLQNTFSAWQKRGLTVRVGSGREGKRGLAQDLGPGIGQFLIKS
ncbi:hypothetical protein [Limobrevibacterium gyesilva]|uniref:Uncharacterized protein n=1 Tax=Limobrevibacterium gyesilva TaxID=2991712 RepID=A0AA41YRZ5_9PROT|nr:hypothetical protein [Limobrevibacterium gyesilva]MCW3474417.1 hypothetical protein [Limobrevibacterium gyesilva]